VNPKLLCICSGLGCNHCKCCTHAPPPHKDSKFFLVWSPGGHTPPKVRYTTRSEADTAAAAMAARYIGQEFFVLETLSRSIAKANVSITALE
jgi:hypothetical protein